MAFEAPLSSTDCWRLDVNKQPPMLGKHGFQTKGEDELGGG